MDTNDGLNIVIATVLYCTVLYRSVLSVAVGAEEVGRVFSVLSLLAAVSTSIVSAAFMKLYRCSNCDDMTSFSVRPKGEGSKEST